MTPEKTYENVCNMLREYDNATGNGYAGAVIDRPWEWEHGTIFPFYESAAKMLIDARAAMDKKTTPAATVAAVKRMTKAAMAHSNTALHGIFPDRGMFAVCDGCRFIRLHEDIESLPHVDLTRVKPLDLSKCTPDRSQFTAEIELPTVAELKAYIAKVKGIAGKEYYMYSWMITDGIYVNPQYLLDMVQIFPDARVYITNPKAPIYFESEAGEGVLLPVNPATAKTA